MNEITRTRIRTHTLYRIRLSLHLCSNLQSDKYPPATRVSAKVAEKALQDALRCVRKM